MKNKIKPFIFIVEDDLMYREIIKNELQETGYINTEMFTSGQDCIDSLYKMPDIILLDFNLEGDLDGQETLRKIKAFNPDIQVVMLSAQESLETAVTSLKYGAFDYVIKDDVAIGRIGKLVTRICAWNDKIEKKRREKKNKVKVLAGVLILCISVLLLNIFVF